MILSFFLHFIIIIKGVVNMFTCTFSDEKNTSVKYLNAYEEPQYWDNANRRSLRFVCAADEIALDELDKLISVAANCKTLTLSSDGESLDGVSEEKTEPTTNIYSDYCIKGRCSKEPVLTGHDPETHAEIYEDRIVFILYRMTPTEKEQELQAAQIAELQKMVAQLMGGK